MNTPLFLTIASSIATASFLMLLLVERSRGTRFLDDARTVLDHGLVRIGNGFAHKVPRFHAGVVRAVFHYSAHLALSLALVTLRRGEALLTRIVRFNRAKAISAVRGPAADTHLREIAEHKESVSLSAAEKRKRKNQALRGEL